ncbi:MAG: SCO family protein, partial [Gemmatimonadota bacterium]
PAAPAPALVLAGAADLPGTRIRLDSLRGEVVVLYFGYTHCPDVCPTTLADWARAKRALGADTTGIRWIFVSVDPTRDSPAEAHGYARQFDPAFMGTAPTDAELALLLKDWAIAAYPEGDPRTLDYTVAHPAHTFVVDADGRFRLMIPPGVRADDIADDLRRLR